MGNGESRSCTKCPGSTIETTAFGAIHSLQAKTSLDVDQMAKLKLKSVAHRETFDQRADRYIRLFSVSSAQLEKCHKSFVHELEIGLECWREASNKGRNIDPEDCSFKMLDSFIKELPSGDEAGVFYAIDFGGTNFRAVRLSLSGGKIECEQYKTSLSSASSHPKGLMDANATATEMFDFFAECMKKFMTEQGDISENDKENKDKLFGVGFTFSFPCVQRKLDSAITIVWTKDFETARNTNDKVEGQDAGELLNMAFKRKKVPMRVAAVMNDTVGTLLSCAYETGNRKPPCVVGIILGTGMNACYYEEDCPKYNYHGNIVNIECGNFNRDLPRTSIDMEIDFHATSNRGLQLIEKMISGAYLGEICRRTIVKVFQQSVPSEAWMVHSLPTEEAAEIADDNSENAVITQKVLQRKWNADMTADHCRIIKKICWAVFDRAAALSSVVIVSCAKKSGRMQPAMGGLTVGVDGSLYKCNKFFREQLRLHIKNLAGEENSKLIHLSLADDGSGKGAGIVASKIDVSGQ